MTNEELLNHVKETFSQELAAIKNEDLREKVARTWVRSMALSGTTDLAKELVMVKEVKTPGVGLEHVKGVVKLAAAIADAMVEAHRVAIDRDTVVAGALLHDVGKLLENAPADRHPLAGKLVRHAFSGIELGLQEGIPNEILHIIAYHSTEGSRIKRTLECQVVYQADGLSADPIYRRELGMTRAERSPYVYITMRSS